ncbi:MULTISPECIES: ROK family transcriptional regulator [Paraliobacillus]|uniref:ROK family transcriptional regulator n=1 Tax=Paraliobacillus TaxID=200903 RepID=UPI000DD4770A|nr:MULTISPECIES: ROK family transcriptional regulator [Paraliobacillus]
MKSLNKSVILNKIVNDGPISRAQIAKDTKLTPPTVGSIVKELIEQDIVKESVQGTSQGGRKPTMLVINHLGFYIIGVDAGPTEIECILTDLSGRITANNTTEITTPISKESFLVTLKNSIHNLLQMNASIEDKIIGIGVAMHGVVDVAEGIALFAPNLDLRDIPIKAELEETFNYTVKVENDARALAIGEVWFGKGKGFASMIAVNIGNGVGAGITINGKLYHGEFSIAGEIGHMTVDLNGKQCECGNRGCLQTVISGPAIAERTTEALKQGEKSTLQSLYEGKLDKITGISVFQAAQQGDSFAQRLLYETGEYIGIGLINLIHTINPSKIIIGGGVSRSGDFILAAIQKTIRARALTPQAKQTEVVLTDLGDQATALGAVALLLVELFERNGEVNV